MHSDNCAAAPAAPSTAVAGAGAGTRVYRYAAALLAVGLVVAIGAGFWNDFFHRVTVYGSARAPNSDALGPWLHGALNYLLYGEPIWYLYRPTIGIFFGSILAVSAHVSAIPAFFAISILAFLLVAIRLADEGLRVPLLGWLVFCATEYALALQGLNVGNVMPDAPAFLFTLLGFYTIARQINAPEKDGKMVCAGFLALGLAAAIRGPMMLAGLVVLAFVCLATPRGRRASVVLPALVLFAAPLAVDAAIQKAHGIVNNGIITLYCYSHDPLRTWTSACQQQFFAAKPSTLSIVVDYLRALLSNEGLTFVVNNLNTRLYQDAIRVQLPGFRLALLLVMLCTIYRIAMSIRALRTANPGRRAPLSDLVHARTYALPRITAVVGTMAAASAELPQYFLMWLSASIAAIAILARLKRTLLALLAYWAAALFLALLAQAHYERLGLTFSFMLYWALFLSIWETSDESADDVRRVRPSNALFGATALLTLFLYLGVFVVPSEWKRIYVASIENQAAALKISQDPALDRCLYITGGGGLGIVYTRCDTLPLGTVHLYTDIDAPAGFANESYRVPARLIP